MWCHLGNDSGDARLHAVPAPAQLTLQQDSMLSLLRPGMHSIVEVGGATLAQRAYAKASNTGSGDQLGYTLALSGDTLAVGAYREASAATGVNGNQADKSIPQAGAVYVFTRTGICTIVDMSSLEIEVDVNESYINRVTPGQPVSAVLEPAGILREGFTTADHYLLHISGHVSGPLRTLMVASAAGVDTALKQDKRGFN